MNSVSRADSGDPRPHAAHDVGGLLDAIRDSIVETAGKEAAEELFFRLGMRWGKSRAEQVRIRGDLQRATQRNLNELAQFKLPAVELQCFEFDVEKRSCQLRGRLLDRGTDSNGAERDISGSACSVSLGVATGFASAVTGLDLVCTPLHCDGVCRSGCGFEIHTAHDYDQDGSQRPSGSARFYLSSVGGSLSDGPISLGDLVEHSADAVILIDRDDIIRFWNRGAETLFQYSRSECVGRKVGFLIPEDLHASGELVAIRRVLERDGKLVNHVTRRVRKDGTTLAVSLTRTMLHDDQGRPIGSTAIIRDITEQRRTEEELSRTRELALVGELAAKVAHEIKNPLAGIYAAVQLLARDLAPTDPKREIFDELGHEIRRLDETTRDLLNFARPLTLKLSPTPLASFAADLVESLLRQPDIARHEIEIEIDPELSIAVDTRLMTQVLSNLVHNAAQAMDTPGHIWIRAERVGDRIALEVADSGPGVPANLANSIFVPFFTTKSRGTGLGLSIAQKNVQAHGGTIRVENAPRGGARFVIELPIPAS